MPSISVHENALAHLSRGLYRSPGSALRELVSNAWDANATGVTINTNYPSFMQLTVKDNGDGFSKGSFTRLMDGGVGNSEKRPDQELKYGRPLIGRLGIGLLGIAQMCGCFTVASRPKTGESFKAEVRLYDLLRPRLDKDDASIVRDDESIRTIDIGEYKFVDPEEQDYGTLITSVDIHPTFVRSFRESLELEGAEEPPLMWEKALTILGSVRSIHQLGDYWNLIWELAATSPVPYVDDRALPKSAVKALHERLVNYNFSVQVDGLQLFKPVSLRGHPAGYTIKRLKQETLTVYGQPVTFEGYIAVQEGAQLKPDELRGIMIRIRNVGVGYYDPSFLDYPINQGPREKWVTGEIYVHDGLDNALNVDRDSFNKFHPEFRALQERIHEALSDVFSRVYKQIDVRSKQRAERIQKERVGRLTEALEATAEGRGVRIRRIKRQLQEEGVLTTINERADGVVELGLADLDRVGVKKPNRQLALAMLAIHKVASLERGVVKQRAKFQQVLMDLLRRW